MTETTRRGLLLAGVWAAVIAPFVGPPASLAAAPTGRVTRLYTRARFAPLRRRSFTLVGDAGSWRVRLSKVGNLPHARRRDPHCFTLTFRASRSGPPQGTYLLRRPRFEPTSIFLVPTDAERRTYEAVFNRVR